MLAPQAKGLFAKGIAESTFARRYWRPLHTDDGSFSAEQVGYAFASKNGVTSVDAGTAKALRALPFSAFANPPGTAQPDQPSPMVDGKLIADRSIYEGFQKGRAAKTPYLVGGNSDEVSLYRPQMVMANEYAAVTKDKDAMLAAFDPEKAGDVVRTVSRLATDWRISEGDRALARLQSKAAPTFVYHFSYMPIASRGTSFGAPHGGEISYAFNTIKTPPPGGFTANRPAPDPEGLAIAQSMNRYWVAFAKTGDPGSAGGVRWPRFEPKDEALIEFGAGGAPVVQNRFHKTRLDWVERNIDWYNPIVFVR
jgi:para-nitrobenzyl esterase